MNDAYRVQKFNFLPPIVKNLLIINTLFLLADYALGAKFNINLNDYLGLHFPGTKYFGWWQYITYMFMHADFSHLFFNMFALWMFGNAIENYWGSVRFLIYYLITGIGAGIVQNVVLGLEIHSVVMQGYAFSAVLPMFQNAVTIGASGAVFGILLAFGMMFPNMLIYIYFLFPMKAKWFVILSAVLELFFGVSGSDGVAHFAHLGGMLFGLILILVWRKKGKIN